MTSAVYTIGHSTHTTDRLLALLCQHRVTAVCDVRSRPYSRLNPQFNRETLKTALRSHGIFYVFLGAELGARSDDPSCYERGRVQYDRVASTDLFRKGLARVQEGMKKYCVALMCAEREPLDCHRTILVARQLATLHIEVAHIHADGRLESHSDAVRRLLCTLKLPENDLFRSRQDLIDEAYRLQEERIAYVASDSGSPSDDRFKDTSG